ncbi:MAG: beta-lactamase family protein [Synergistaceae bacterium]|nr:beta-lactamase family protein [Synergistaceae bacterium]
MKIVLFFLFLFAAASALNGCAGPASAAASRSQQQRRAEDSRREFQSFVDGFFAGTRRDWNIPGMAFVAVSGGEVIYLKGYGVADTRSGAPVSPDATLFRVGGVSTAITATAILQLAESKRLGLDEDVNIFLRRWKLPQTFEAPVTFRHILTHTGGFDGKALEINAPTSADERNYGLRLQKAMPARYAPPGRYYSYSRMGYALLGSIIERYSRQNFQASVTRHVFQPLGMKDSTFSPDAGQMSRLATGYDSEGRPVGYEYFYDMPASAMSATASDMGRFMMAQLGDGALGRNRVLTPMYANSMLRRHFSPHPLIEGTGLAYREKFISGIRTLQLSGSIRGYTSFMMLIPEKGFGLFFAANASGLELDDDLARAVVDRFFAPASPRSPDVAPLSRAEAAPPGIDGFYRHNVISRHTAEKIMYLTADQLQVSSSGDLVTISHTKGGGPATQWVPASVASGDILLRIGANGEAVGEYAYVDRENGAVRALVIGDVSRTYDKLPPYEGRYRQMAIIFCFLSVVVVSCLGAVIGVAVNKGKLPWEKGLRSAVELWSISLLFCGIQIAFVVCLLASVYYVGAEFTVFVPYQVKALFTIPAAGCLILAWFWFRLLGNLLKPDYHWAEKLLLVAVAAMETGYVFFLANWRLLGFMF